MRLRSLEIQGFKSFPDRTKLSFHDGITAVVGPNGSGKSNIADAVRWVLGEQSTKTLRGGKMEDVIFGGTEKRSQMGFAQVTLVLDNTEHIFPRMEESEVAVTRRYYRSGESEYYINKQSVRLRDVNELFMDTGMGREGYSIVGQGKIDEILSVKSADRREIFEEAAGISKFRHRKEETERKLERTEENLVRINDKIAELELQVGPLRSQAEKAKKYLILRDELRTLEISVWLENLDKIKTDSIKLNTDYALAQQELERANAALDELYAAIGYGGMTIANCLPKLKEEWQKLKASEEKAGEDLPKVDLSRVHATDGVVVEGFDNTPIKFAKCCSPLPGDPIVGFITRGFGVSIHKQSCVNAISSMKDPTNAPRWVKAYWADSVKDSYKAGIEIIALNRNELLQDVLAALADIRVPIYAVNARQVENNCAMVSLTIGINNTEHLNRVVARLSKVKDVLKVTRS